PARAHRPSVQPAGSAPRTPPPAPLLANPDPSRFFALARGGAADTPAVERDDPAGLPRFSDAAREPLVPPVPGPLVGTPRRSSPARESTSDTGRKSSSTSRSALESEAPYVRSLGADRQELDAAAAAEHSCSPLSAISQRARVARPGPSLSSGGPLPGVGCRATYLSRRLFGPASTPLAGCGTPTAQLHTSPVPHTWPPRALAQEAARARSGGRTQ